MLHSAPDENSNRLSDALIILLRGPLRDCRGSISLVSSCKTEMKAKHNLSAALINHIGYLRGELHYHYRGIY